MASISTCSQQRLLKTSSQQLSWPVVRPAVPRKATVVTRAAKLPQGVTTPPRTPKSPEARFGFVRWAENINGRAAMLGFFGILLVEAIAHKGIFEMTGFTVGQGLGFEF